MSGSPLRVSVAMIAMNEEANLPRSLASVEWADEIVVVDSGSTDRTQEIAASLGAKVLDLPWQGFVQQKNLAIQHCTGDWILSLDADEEVTPALAEELQQAARAPGDAVAFSLPRITMFLDRWMRHGGWYPDRQIRLFKAGAARFEGDKVHERMVADGPVGELKQDLLHYSYPTIQSYIDRMNRYSSLRAEEMIAKGKTWKPSAAKMAWPLLSKWLEVYVWKRGFLDGRHGFIVATLAAYGVFLRQCKIWQQKP